MNQTDWLFVALGIGIAVIIAETILLVRKKPAAGPGVAEDVPGRDVPPLLTQAEYECFNALHQVAGREMHVMAKVSLSDIAIVKRDVDKRLIEKAVKKGQSYVDFILCDREKLGVVCAIELQEARPRGKGPNAADLLEQLGVVIFRLPKKTSYSVQEIREILSPFLKEKPPTPDQMVATISMEAFRACKKCKTRMVLKRAKSGKYKGTLFWVCGRHPECNTVELFTH